MHPTLFDRVSFRPLAIMLLAAAVLLCTSCDEEASGDAAKATAPPGTPEIQFEFQEHDFGRVVDTQTYQISFPFTNSGTDTLQIEKVTAACGCTTPTMAKRAYAPGEQGTIDVSFNPKGKEGNTAKHITVATNASDPVKLIIHSDIRPLVGHEKLIKLGDVPLGQNFTTTVPFRYSDPNLVVTGLTVNNPNVQVRQAGLGEVLSGEPDPLYGGKIEVTVKDTQPWGVIFATKLTLAVYGRPSPDVAPVQQTYDMFIMGDVFGDLRTNTTMVNMGSLRPQTDYSKSTVISSSTGRPFEVTSARVKESTVPGIKVRHRQLSPSSHEITLYGNLGSFVGSFRGTIEVATGENDEGPLYLRFAGGSRR